MNWYFVLLLAIPLGALAGGWKPPENPDSDKILQEARKATDAGRYEEALAMYVWFRHHALKYSPDLYAVRLSFALGHWRELGRVYPPALARFKELREVAWQDVMQGTNLRESFADLAAMNQTLGEPERTKDAFVALDADHPDRAKQIYQLAQPALVASQAYALCGKYIESQTSISQLAERFHQHDDVGEDTRFGKSRRSFADKQFTSKTATLVALLVLNERQDEAESVAHAARQEWDDRQFHVALERALKGELPTPWP